MTDETVAEWLAAGIRHDEEGDPLSPSRITAMCRRRPDLAANVIGSLMAHEARLIGAIDTFRDGLSDDAQLALAAAELDIDISTSDAQ